MEIGDNLNWNAEQLQSFFLVPKNTSPVIHDASCYEPDVANVCYVALIYVNDEM